MVILIIKYKMWIKNKIIFSDYNKDYYRQFWTYKTGNMGFEFIKI